MNSIANEPIQRARDDNYIYHFQGLTVSVFAQVCKGCLDVGTKTGQVKHETRKNWPDQNSAKKTRLEIN